MNSQHCIADGCEEKARGRGLCKTHYGRAYRSGEFVGTYVERPRAQSFVRDQLGRKLCKGCDEWLDESHFYDRRKALKRTREKWPADGLSSECKRCLRTRKMGITAASLDAILAEQDNRCAVCLRDLSHGKFRIDHDHACCPGQKGCGGCIRGVLCVACNVALGNLGDGRDIELLRRLVRYAQGEMKPTRIEQCSRHPDRYGDHE